MGQQLKGYMETKTTVVIGVVKNLISNHSPGRHRTTDLSPVCSQERTWELIETGSAF
jgi:hypothetical protein